MRWTFEEYLDQPTWFITMLFELLKAEAEHANSKV